jgi:primosomal protein N' (replication factor Y) (superfamily II helicase)
MSSNSDQLFVEVILPINISSTFTYAVPSHWQGTLTKGMRVVVPFGKSKIYTGIVIDIVSAYNGEFAIKDIIEILDDTQFVTNTQLAFWKWIASYYMCSLGEIMAAAIPSVFRLESQSIIRLHPDIDDERLVGFEFSSKTQESIFQHIVQQKQLTIQQLIKQICVKNPLYALKQLVEQDILTITHEVNEKLLPKYATYVRLTAIAQHKIDSIFEEIKRAKKQVQLLETYIYLSQLDDNTKHNPVLKSGLLQRAAVSEAVLSDLVKKQVLEVYKLPISRFQHSASSSEHKLVLSTHQERAYKEIVGYFEVKKPVLLHGVTSSGKTEVYIQLIQDALEKGKQVLYLVPEIALTIQLLHRLEHAFGNKVGIFHSKYSDQERAEVYQNLLSPNPYKIIIGVRSSIFLPFHNLGLIIVDEEHEQSYKQVDPAPRYHARNAAIVLASITQSNVLLGTATPAVETYYNVSTNKYAYVSLTSRYQNVLLPIVRVIDVADAYKKNRMKSMFSWFLIEKMKEAIEQNEQVVLFQNRRGFSSHIECQQCGWVPKCMACDVSLTYHKFANYLSCHYCGHTELVPTQCPQCGNNQLKDRGFGTEKIEEELSKLFPGIRTARMDLDTTSKKNAYKKLIQSFENHQIDVLIGTQMITKGLHFDNVSLVGILNADNLFNYPDFRANERAMQMLVQVSGRAGRKQKQGTVVLQTFSPHNPIIEYIVNNDYAGFYSTETEERKLFNYPPYCRLMHIYVKDANKEQADKIINELAVHLRKVFGNRVIGPDNPPVAKIQYIYIKKLILKIELQSSFEKAKEITQELINALSNQYKKTRIVVDIDPL